MLSAYRVLDLTDERGHLAGQILGLLGAEVIAIEPPEGSSARRLGPFAGGEADPERSLHFWSYNRGKKSVVLDLDTEEGKSNLRRLAAGADFLIESDDPGVMAERGLGYDDLAGDNEALIYVSISAFGGTGPKAGWQSTDLTVLASSGQLMLTGDDDRPPVRVSLPQGFHHAAAEGAAAALIALYERQSRSGLGQHIDMSAQQSMNQASQSMMLAALLNADHTERMAGGVKLAGLGVQLMWPCADGHASVTFLFGPGIGPFTRNLMEWVCEEGFCDEATRDKDWLDYTMMLLDGREPVSEYERLKGVLTDFFATKTKAELFDAAFERRLLIVPVTTIEDVSNSPQLADRGFWEDVDHGEIGAVRYPGAMGKFTETPLMPLPAAPSLGADTDSVLGEADRKPSVAVAKTTAATAPPLEGLKVLDLMWVMAGPAGSRVLADYGADIIRVESANKIDTARTLQPFLNNEGDPEYSGLWNNMNAGKRGLALDMSKDAAVGVILDLVDWADVVLESFSPKAMKGWGLDYETLRQRKPDLIMLSTCLMGQSGPHSQLAGFGTMAAAISGFFNIAGWPDRAPAGPVGAYTDYVAPRFLVAALMAAIEHKRATGVGQFIDLAQGECSMQLLTPALLDFAVNGHIWERAGNDDPVFDPHGVYPAAGDDRWIAIACRNDEDRAQLAAEIGFDDLSEDAIAAWTSTQEAEAAMESLQARHVPAHVVSNTDECVADPQLAHRNHFVEVEHAKQGTTFVEGTRFVMSRTPAVITHGAPTFGEHTFDILTDVLGYDGDRIAELAAAQLLE